MSNEHLKSKISDESRPYVLFSRTVNEHLGEQLGEKRDVQWQCFLYDTKGSPYVWARLSRIQALIEKGWRVIGHGGLELDNANVQAIRAVVSTLAEAHAEVQAAKAEAAGKKR